MTTTLTAEAPTPETTDLERRVLAHERILQSLIAYMSRAEPHFIDHLRQRFVEPMATTTHEHDHRETDDYAEEFVRAVILLGKSERTAAHAASEKRRSPPATGEDPPPAGCPSPHVPQDRVKVRERRGVWAVSVDGIFKGDYHREEHARAAAALAKLSIGEPGSSILPRPSSAQKEYRTIDE